MTTYLISCNAVLKRLSPETKLKKLIDIVQKKMLIVKYENCQTYNTGHFQLTSNDIKASIFDISSSIDVYNKNFLSPTNPKYKISYENLLKEELIPTFHNNDIKIFVLFGTDSGILNSANGKIRYPWFKIFEAIVDTSKQIKYIEFNKEGYHTGYEELHEHYSNIIIPNNTNPFTFTNLGTLHKDKYDPNRFSSTYSHTITDTAIAYLIRHTQKVKKHNEIVHSISSNTGNEEFINFARIDLVEQLQNKLCITDDIPKCTTEFMSNTIQNMCQTQPKLELAHNDIFSVTCKNIKDYITLYEQQHSYTTPSLAPTTGYHELYPA